MNENKFSPRAEEALRLSQEAAGELGHGYVGTEHLLAGILREGNNMAVRILRTAGVDARHLYTALMQKLGEMPRSQAADPGRSGTSPAKEDNGKNKTLDYGRQVFAFAAGTKKLYDYVNKNPDVMGAPVDYTNDVHVISQLDKFISINNIVDLDLFGQVNAESAGIKHISGTGGQLDFAMGAYLSNGGKSFICMSSTVTGKDGTVKSRIVPTLTPGSICTDPRSCTHYIVTEYGMVNLKGLSTWERAEALIGIAHPDFREQLIADAEKMHIWRRSNK